MIILLKYIWFKETWIVPAREAPETPKEAVRVEAPCPDGDTDMCTYYILSLKPLPQDLVEAVKHVLSLMHYNVEDEELLLNTANALITIHNSDCYHLVTPAKLVYELALKAGLRIEAREVEYEDGWRKTQYYIKGVGTVNKMERRSMWCLIANRTIEPSLVEKWTF